MLIDEFEKVSLKKFNIKSIMPDATVLLLGRRRSGKSLKKGEKVLMFDGSIRLVEDIKVGDLVMGDDSTPRTVIETHSGEDILYHITNTRNESYTVNSHHILSLIHTKRKTLKDLLKKQIYHVSWFNKVTYKTQTKTFSYKKRDKNEVYQEANNFFEKITDDNKIDIPIKNFLTLSKNEKSHFLGYQIPIHFCEKELQIDPYVIGCDFENCIVDFELYKCNSREHRLAFLAGYIDNNSLVNKNKLLEITIPKDEKKRDDLVFIIRSLGFSVNYTKGRGDCIYITGRDMKEIPTRKIQINNVDTNDTLLSQIKIEEVGKGEYFGIELDGNNRFVLGNFIVTHNSWLVRDIFYHHKHIPSGVIFSGTEEASPFFSDFIPDCFIHSEYDPALVEAIMTRQKRKIRETKQSGKSDTGKLSTNNLFIVLDDMLHDAQNWKKEKTIKNIFFNGRHYNFLFMLTMQYPLGITPELRSNIDYVFIFNEPSVKNRKKIYDDYAGMIPSFDHFCNILDSCTQNHECLVIKTSGNSSDYKDQVFWYKSEPHSNFQVGHPKFWKYHNINYNVKYEEDNEEDEENLLKLKKKFAKTRKLKVIVSRQGDIVGYKQEDD